MAFAYDTYTTSHNNKGVLGGTLTLQNPLPRRGLLVMTVATPINNIDAALRTRALLVRL